MTTHLPSLRTAVSVPMTVTMLCACTLFAQTDNTWLGDTDNLWTTDANWSAGAAPDNGTGGAYNVIFNDPADSTFQPDTSGGGPGRDANTVTFNQAGWTISGAGDEIQFFAPSGSTHISSNGAGVNRIDSGVEASGSAGSGTNIDTAAGNTLVIAHKCEIGADKNGSGTLVIDTGANFNPRGSAVNVNNGTLLINGTFDHNDFGHDTFVNSGATLGGIGVTDQTNRVTYDVRSGGTINPGGDGTFGPVIGTFEVSNGRGSGDRDSTFTFQTGSVYHADIDAAGNSDHLMFTKSAANDASDVFLNIQSGVNLELWGSPAYGVEYDLFSVHGIDTRYDGSQFGSVALNGSPLTEGLEYTATYISTGDDDETIGGLKLTLIPEPSSLVLVSMVAALLLARRRR